MSSADAPAQPPPVAVDVAPAESDEIVEYRVFTGRTAAVNSVEIRPRVSGYLLQTPRTDSAVSASGRLPGGDPHHKEILRRDRPVAEDPPRPEESEGERPFVVLAAEGTRVRAGDPLFEIDPEPYRLAYRQAVGNLEATRAQLMRYRRQRIRLEQLVPEAAASRTEYDEAVANEAEATARIETLEAQVDRAYLDWQYTQVRSPIDGIVGQTLLTQGNLAVADTTVLTTVVRTNPIYVYFDVDENSMLDYTRRVYQGQVESPREARIEVDMALANDEGFPHHGYIDFVSNVTDPETGNTTLRAVFDNPSGALVPGWFARVQTPFTAPYEAVLIPTIALATDQQGRYVMVIDDQMTAHRRAVEVGTQQGNQTVVREGVEPGELVVVSGLQRVRDGATVSIAEESVAAAESSGSSKTVQGPRSGARDAVRSADAAAERGNAS